MGDWVKGLGLPEFVPDPVVATAHIPIWAIGLRRPNQNASPALSATYCTSIVDDCTALPRPNATQRQPSYIAPRQRNATHATEWPQDQLTDYMEAIEETTDES